jgi:hypothetical protein
VRPSSVMASFGFHRTTIQMAQGGIKAWRGTEGAAGQAGDGTATQLDAASGATGASLDQRPRSASAWSRFRVAVCGSRPIERKFNIAVRQPDPQDRRAAPEGADLHRCWGSLSRGDRVRVGRRAPGIATGLVRTDCRSSGRAPVLRLIIRLARRAITLRSMTRIGGHPRRYSAGPGQMTMRRKVNPEDDEE